MFLTPSRVAFLAHLNAHGPTRWSCMPDPTKHAVTNRVWRPLINAGLVDGEFKEKFPYRADWWFTITDAGRTALMKAALKVKA